MKFIKPTISNIILKSENKQYIDFEHTNPIVNLEQVISFRELEVTSNGITNKIPSIRFYTANPSPIVWCFSNEKDRAENLLHILEVVRLRT